jgi:aminoglycoside phosphotransferase (APT) family kinase protein
MIDKRSSQILRYITRDLDSVIAPELTSARAQFLLGAIKSLLDTIANGTSAASAGLGAEAGLAALIAEAQAQRPDAAGARDAAYRQSGSGRQEGAAAEVTVLAPISSRQVIDYLGTREPYRWLRQATVTQAPGGFSKETFLVSLEGGDRMEQIVLRRDPAFSPLRSTVIDEFPVLSNLSRLALPIPRMLWQVPDPAPFGAPVIAMGRLAGSADVQRWSETRAMAEPVIDQAASLLARLHQPDVLEACAPPPVIPGARGDTPRAMVDDLRKFWRSMSIRGDGLTEAVFDWLELHAPACFAKRALLHGDFGFHNLLVEGGRITGLLDWEFCHVGDVAEDLAYARPFVEQVVPWKEFDAIYRGHGGPAVADAAMNFWGVFGLFRIGLGCYATVHAIDLGNMRLDSKAAFVGQTYAKPFIIDAAKSILKAQ